MSKSLRAVIAFWAKPEQRGEEPIIGALCAAFLEMEAENRELRERMERSEAILRKRVGSVSCGS